MHGYFGYALFCKHNGGDGHAGDLRRMGGFAVEAVAAVIREGDLVFTHRQIHGDGLCFS